MPQPTGLRRRVEATILFGLVGFILLGMAFGVLSLLWKTGATLVSLVS